MRFIRTLQKVSPELLAVLACPKCDERPPLEEVEEGLRCAVCGTVYPVVDGIPHLVADLSQVLGVEKNDE